MYKHAATSVNDIRSTKVIIHSVIDFTHHYRLPEREDRILKAVGERAVGERAVGMKAVGKIAVGEMAVGVKAVGEMAD